MNEYEWNNTPEEEQETGKAASEPVSEFVNEPVSEPVNEPVQEAVVENVEAAAPAAERCDCPRLNGGA